MSKPAFELESEGRITPEYLPEQKAKLGEYEFTVRAIAGAVSTLQTLAMLAKVCALHPEGEQEAAAKSFDYAQKLALQTAKRLVATLSGEWAEAARLHNEGLDLVPPTEDDLNVSIKTRGH